eukprot:6603755-Pyramimonas_sp.AAC.1
MLLRSASSSSSSPLSRSAAALADAALCASRRSRGTCCSHCCARPVLSMPEAWPKASKKAAA